MRNPTLATSNWIKACVRGHEAMLNARGRIEGKTSKNISTDIFRAVAQKSRNVSAIVRLGLQQ